MLLVEDIKKIKIKKKSIGIFWVGQAGYIFKLSNGSIIFSDIYLTHCVERIYGFKRITPSPISIEFAKNLEADLIISTHEHEDHFDIDAISILINNNKTKLAGPEAIIKKSRSLGLKDDKLLTLKEGSVVSFKGYNIKAVSADHGTLCPDAIGIILDVDGIKIYYTGDTSYRPDKMKAALNEDLDIIIFPINGQFGNLNPEEAVRIVNSSSAKIAIPCHFWTFIEHNGDPKDFAKKLEKSSSKCEVKFLMQGEGFIYSK